MGEKPLDYSTPKHVHVSGRRPIRDQDSIQSPIENMEISEMDNSIIESESQSDYDSQEENYTETSEEQSRNNFRNEQSSNWYFFALIFACTSIPLVLLYQHEDVNTENMKTGIYLIDDFTKEFPTQVDDFWISVKVAISEVKRTNRTKSIILLYENDGKQTLDNILRRITYVAVCEITSCSSKPIIIEEGELNTVDVLEDYGKIITKNKEQLRKTGVMVIKNLETVPGISAQAFHSLCDEYNPEIHKALFLFTMRVNSFSSNNMKLIENQLRNLWSDLKDDKFFPLFTRISDFVLPVNPEQ